MKWQLITPICFLAATVFVYICILLLKDSSTRRHEQELLGRNVGENDYFIYDAGLQEKLLKRLNKYGEFDDPATPRPLVTLEEFFEGNNDYGSIGYNLTPQPSPSEFYDYFMAIRNKSEVHDVLVEVKDLESEAGWPATDTIWIVTTAHLEDVKNWFDDNFAPDNIFQDFEVDDRIEPYNVPDGHIVIGIWWD